MNRIWKVGSLGIDVKRVMYKGMVVLILLHGAETGGLNVGEKRRLDMMEIK